MNDETKVFVFCMAVLLFTGWLFLARIFPYLINHW